MEKKEIKERIDKIISEGGFGLQRLFDKEYDGSCPCFDGILKIDGKDFAVQGRCWRVSENKQDLHYYGDDEIANKIKEALDKQEWYNPYTLIKHDSIDYFNH